MYLNPDNDREEALNALDSAQEHESPKWAAITVGRALVFAVLDVAAAIRESNQKPTEIPDKP